jgi:predicted nuclease with TOPRIM domain
MLLGMEKPKKITIGILAGMMNRSFESLTTNIQEIKVDVSEIKVRISNLDSRLESVENRLESVEQKISFGNDNRMNRPEDDVRKIKSKLDL